MAEGRSPHTRTRWWLLIIPTAYALSFFGLIALADNLLPRFVGAFVQGAFGLESNSTEVSLLRGRVTMTGLHGHDRSGIRSVEEVRIEGIGLYALVFGRNDTVLIQRILVRGLEPEFAEEKISLERAEIVELSGSFPGIFTLVELSDREGEKALQRVFGQMRAKVVSLEGLHAGSAHTGFTVKAFLATELSFSGQNHAMLLDGKFWDADGSFSVGHAMLGTRSTPDVEALEGRNRDITKADHLRLAKIGLYQNGAVFLRPGCNMDDLGGLRADLVTGAVFSNAEATRGVLDWQGLRCTIAKHLAGPDYRPETFSGGLHLEGHAQGGAMDHALQLDLNGTGPQARSNIHLDWKLASRQVGEPLSYFPALEMHEPMLLKADLRLGSRGGPKDLVRSVGLALGFPPETSHAQFVDELTANLVEFFPALFNEGRLSQVRSFLNHGGELALAAHPPEPLPLVLIDDAAQGALSSLGWSQTFNGSAAQ